MKENYFVQTKNLFARFKRFPDFFAHDGLKHPYVQTFIRKNLFEEKGWKQYVIL